MSRGKGRVCDVIKIGLVWNVRLYCGNLKSC
jgi:hypothetical protein